VTGCPRDSSIKPSTSSRWTVKPLAHNPALLPVFLHLGLVLVLGLWIPGYLNGWFRQAAQMVG
jgi:hydrogenase-4 component F